MACEDCNLILEFSFLTLGGFADFMLPSVLGGAAHGAIMGLANVYPVSIAYERLLDVLLTHSPSSTASKSYSDRPPP